VIEGRKSLSKLPDFYSREFRAPSLTSLVTLARRELFWKFTLMYTQWSCVTSDEDKKQKLLAFCEENGIYLKAQPPPKPEMRPYRDFVLRAISKDELVIPQKQLWVQLLGYDKKEDLPIEKTGWLTKKTPGEVQIDRFLFF
jgi:hypothetical protein